jgi:hypothetical protein
MSLHYVSLPETLYNRLKTLADIKGQTIELFIQEVLEETIDETPSFEQDILSFSLQAFPQPDVLLPPYGSPEEALLRTQLATVLSKGSSLSQLIIEERGER